MPKAVLMPKLSSTMTDGSVNEWFVEEGDYVKVGDPLFEVETDKIAIEVESYYEGYLLKKYIGINEEVPCNSTIAYIGEEGAKVPDTIDFYSDNLDQEIAESQVAEIKPLEENTLTITQESNEKVRATPFARKLASQNDVNLIDIEGTGKYGRIQANDVKSFIGEVKNESLEEVTMIPWKGMRKAIADNMTHSYTTIPHISMVATADVASMKQLKNKLSSLNGLTITYTDLIAYFTINALKHYPILNARTSPEGIEQYQNINLGIAVGLEEGLIVPVINGANHKSVSDLSKDIKVLSMKAHENKLNASETKGGTFTISSLGRTRVKNFTSIINYPEVGILGIGGIYQEGDKEFIDLILTFDHRVLDGLPASNFLNYLIELVENPELSIF